MLEGFTKENDKMTALAHATYQLVHQSIDKAVDTSLLNDHNQVAYVGGITINIEGSTDMFLPLTFDVYNHGEITSHLEDFGNPNLSPGCIDYMFLTDNLCEYTAWFRDALGK